VRNRRAHDTNSNNKLDGMILGVGTDIVAMERIEKLVTEYGERFTAKVYTDRELANAEGKGPRRLQHLAGLFAAKEAVLKALGTGQSQGARLRDVELTPQDSGAPQVTLHGATQKRFERGGGSAVHVSISHDAGLAVALAIIDLDGSRDSDPEAEAD